MENGSSTVDAIKTSTSRVKNMVKDSSLCVAQHTANKCISANRTENRKTISRPSTPKSSPRPSTPKSSSRPGTPKTSSNQTLHSQKPKPAQGESKVKEDQQLPNLTKTESIEPQQIARLIPRVKPKLVLHFDVRNTILVADTVTKVNIGQAFNTFLTGVAWGKEVGEKWDWSHDIPSLTSPASGLVTYYKHLEKRIVRTPEDRAILRLLTGDFTQEEIGKKFRPYFEKHMQHLRWPYGENGDPDLVMKGGDGTPYHYILPAFFKVIHHLHKEERDFCVIIRTYGMDAPQVLSCTEKTLQGNHPQFPDPLPIDVNTIPGKVFRTKSGKIAFEKYSPLDGSGRTPRETITTERDIYEMFNRSTGVTAFKDDFPFWQDNEFHHSAAKPVWIDPHDRSVHHIFFDDNIRTWDVDSIVDLRLFNDDGTSRSIEMKESEKYLNAVLVAADLLQSTSNEDYFIEKVNVCEENFAKLIDNLS